MGSIFAAAHGDKRASTHPAAQRPESSLTQLLPLHKGSWLHSSISWGSFPTPEALSSQLKDPE